MALTQLPDTIYRAALTSGRFLSKDREVIAAQLAEMPLEDIVALKGLGSKKIVTYARWASREAELLQLDNVQFPRGVDADEGRKEIFLERLKREFDAQTFNDEINLEYLAELYVQRWNLSRTNMASPDSEGSRVAKQVSDSILALERHLQIDPQTRAEQAAAADPAAIIGDWVDQSALYLADEGVIHDTEHGPAGYTIWHFKTAEYMPKCADCGGQHFVFRSPWDEQDYPFVVAREDQVNRYVKGRDFKPEGAPNLSIFEEKQ
jgi:hypothetical protein